MLKHSFWILLPCVIFLIFIYLFIPRQTLSCIPNVGCTLEEKSVISGSISFQSFKQSDILYGYTKSNKHYRFGSHKHFSSYIPVLVMKDNTKIELENLSFKFETPAENFVNDIKMNKKVCNIILIILIIALVAVISIIAIKVNICRKYLLFNFFAVILIVFHH